MTTPEGTRTVLEIGFEVDNDSNVAARIDPGTLALESVETPSTTYRDLVPSRVTGSLVAPPRGSTRATAYFPMPRSTSPEQVKSFRVRWTIAAGTARYARMTPFVQNRPRYAYYVPYGVYDDFDFDEGFDEGDFDEGFDEGDFDEGGVDEGEGGTDRD